MGSLGMKLSTCKCGNVFVPKERGERLCNNCRRKEHVAKPCKCVIVEAPGRCEGYMKGICEECLDWCAEQGWVGWKSYGAEWWKGIVTILPEGL